jgi:hypothetical protein
MRANKGTAKTSLSENIYSIKKHMVFTLLVYGEARMLLCASPDLYTYTPAHKVANSPPKPSSRLDATAKGSSRDRLRVAFVAPIS